MMKSPPVPRPARLGAGTRHVPRALGALLVVLACSLSFAPAAWSQIAVTFRVNMQSEEGLNDGYDRYSEPPPVVGLRGGNLGGGGPLEWGTTEVLLARESSDPNDPGFDIYSATVTYPSGLAGTTQEYKFRLEPGAWEEGNLTGNRSFVVPATDTELALVNYGDTPSVDPGTVPAEATVTFEVDVTPLVDFGLFDGARGDVLDVRGFLNGWDCIEPDCVLTSRGGDPNVLSADITFEALPGTELGYKFFTTLNVADVPAGWEEPLDFGGGNRFLEWNGSLTDPGRQYFNTARPGNLVPDGASIEVTFGVDMRPALGFADAFDPATEQVRVELDDALWIYTQTNARGVAALDELYLTDPDGDLIYEGTFTVLGPTYNGIGYAFAYGRAGDGWTREGTATLDAGRRRYQYVQPEAGGTFAASYLLPRLQIQESGLLPFECNPTAELAELPADILSLCYEAGSVPAGTDIDVQYAAVSAARDLADVVVAWTTASETSSDRFEVERSTGGDPFETVGTVAGAGTSAAPVDYTFADAVAPAAALRYRLKQVSADGSFTYSPVVAVDALPIVEEDPPAAPERLAAASSETAVALTWTPGEGPAATSWAVYRDGSLVGTPSAPSFTDSGLVPGMRHVYRVAGVGSVEGPLSDPLIAVAGEESGAQAVVLDGVDDYVGLDAVAPGLADGAFTVAAWVRLAPEQVERFVPVIAVNGDGLGGADQVHAVTWVPEENKLEYYDNTFGYRYAERAMATDQWHFVALAVEPAPAGSRATTYLNGEEILSVETATPTSSARHLSFGQEWDGGTPTQFANAAFDEVSVWDRALAQEEIAALAGARVEPGAAGLLAYLPFDGTGEDLSPNGNDALVAGAAFTADDAPLAFARLTVEGTAGLGNDAGWRMLSAPTAGALRTDLTDDVTFSVSEGSNDVFYTWDGQGWADRRTLAAGRGFIVYLFDDATDPVDPALTFDVTGLPGAADVAVGGLAQGDTWHLLGNPFEAAFDLAALDLAASGFQATVQVWDPEAQSYVLLTGGDVVAAWQGFFAERSTAGSGATQLTFPVSGAAGSGTFYGKEREQVAGKTAADTRRLGLELVAYDAEGAAASRDRAAGVLFHAEAVRGFDAYEATKRPSLSAGAALLTIAGERGGEAVRLAQASLPSDLAGSETLVLSVETSGDEADAAEGELALTWPVVEAIPDDWTLTLRDRASGATVDLRQASEYRFTPSGDDADRFELTIAGSVGTAIDDEALPQAFALEAAYPNPFNPQTTVAYALPQAADVRLAVYDVLGREVAVLADGPTAAGRHTVRWDAAGQASGVYLVRLEAAGQVQTQRVTLVK